MPYLGQQSARRTRWWRRCLGAAATALVMALGTGAAAQAGADTASSPGGLTRFREGTVSVDGGSLHYVKGGSGPALVLLHGWPETWYEWRKVMPDLARTHTVVAFDLPGLGSSGVPDGGFDAVHTAARIHQGVAKLGYDRVSLLAHDLGALVAYPYARDFPDDVARMAVLETPLNGFGLENAYGLSWHLLFNQTAAPVPENLINDAAHVKTYLGWLFSSARHPDAIAQSAFIRAYSDASHRSAGFNYYRAFPTNAADNKALSSVKVTLPVLAMGAQYTFGPAVAQSFGAVATDVRQVVAPDSGHWIPEENPAFLIQCATLFFGSGATSTDPSLEGCNP
ncbi:alpha/beta fold hydrolase [Actinomadura opuntiae]|uniref:alpha/beta fold hydrolase n=1 Tax=Actinomadura sp. OS1-43 TaxID=604315 RepID=UPI00255A9061|nr:alpha/beta fold hydrolase [Actinomadura sp. OS1-43]MDL4820230.1 alpha/beta fold hydrolase [Actinomadura sp. OS1-43]